MDNHQALIKQVLFYLSDENLAKDEFFYDKVAADPDHFVDFKCFLDCNKVKKLGYTKADQLIQAIQKSNELELNPEKNKLRKKGLANVPQFKGKKKVKSDKENNQHNNPYINMKTVIFSLSLDQDKTVPFKYIQQSLLKNHNTYSPYVRFNKNEGNFAVQQKNCSPELIKKLQAQGLKVGQTVLKVLKAEGDKLNEFWQKHGHHYNGIIDNLRKQFDKKIKNEKKAHNLPKKVTVFEFGGEKYDDINKLKSLFKNILARNPNNQPLKEKQANLIKQLLSYHSRGQEKLKGFVNFVVDVNPTYSDTRCFFIVRDDGTREDFSVVKCIKNIEDKYSA